MSQSTRTELYRPRNFNQFFHDTISFLKAHFISLAKSYLAIVMPLALLTSLSFGLYFSFIMKWMFLKSPIYLSDSGESLKSMALYLGLAGIGMFVTYGLMANGVVYSWFRVYRESGESDISPVHVWRVFIRRVWPVFGLQLMKTLTALLLYVLIIATVVYKLYLIAALTGIIMIFGMIYLSIPLCFSVPALFIDNVSLFQAIKIGFSLVRGRWWLTAMQLFLAYMIQYMLSMVFMIPFYILYFIMMMSAISRTKPDFDMSAWGMLSSSFMMVGQIFCSIIMFCSVAMLYFTYSSVNKGTSILSDIDQLGTYTDKDSVDQGDY